MTNLLKETIGDITNSGHNPKDIIFIGSVRSGYSCTWEEFKLLADFEYDSGYGSQKVATDLAIFFSENSYMSRKEYDGSEWWEYCSPQKLPTQTRKITTLGGDERMWSSLKEINEDNI